MVYTVTLNPSLDYIVTVDGFSLGKTNRTASEQMLCGGKGINVSAVLSNLGVENMALGFTAGFVGEEIERRMARAGLNCDFIRLKEGCSRINVKLRNYDGTEINGAGPSVGPEELERLMEKLDRLGQGDVLVLAGSIPAQCPENLYCRMMERLAGRGVLTAVDASGKTLAETLSCRPFLIKPNRDELEGLLGERASSPEEALSGAEKLQRMGAENVLVSMGGDGAVLLDRTGKGHCLKAPKGELVNSVGAGDSMVAGFLAGWLEKNDYFHAFAMGVAAGSASAFSDGLATADQVRSLYNGLTGQTSSSLGS